MEEKEYKYMVASRCFTFNHAPYIVDAMNGFAMQETTFTVPYLIVDDASTDGEQDVIRQYLADNFESPYREEETDDYNLICAKHKTNPCCVFIVFLLKYNHYRKKSKMPYISEWLDNAKYHALCEGDDYWIDSQKLKKQVDYLEQHKEIGVVHAKAKVYNQDNHCYRGTCGEHSGDFLQTLIKNPIVTLTSCYRSSLFHNYQKERSGWKTTGWKMRDYPMWIWMSYYSSIYFLDEVVAVYRELKGSASHPEKLEDKIAFIISTKDIQLFFADMFNQDDKVKKVIKSNSAKKCVHACYKYGDNKAAKKYLKDLSFIDQIRYIFKH